MTLSNTVTSIVEAALVFRLDFDYLVFIKLAQNVCFDDSSEEFVG